MTETLDAVRGDPVKLKALLARFPKGGDLHNHMSGSVYAESYLAWAREDGMQVDQNLKLVDPTTCKPGACRALPASPDDPRYDEIIRAWSMKDFAPGAETGHDHFFAAFSKFGLVSHEASREPAMLAEAIRRTADDGAIYLETLVTIARPLVNDIAKSAGPIDPKDFSGYARKLRADKRWPELIASAHAAFDEREQKARALMKCNTPEAERGCSITVRYDGQIGRTSVAGQVFAELLAAYEVAQTEPRIAAINLVSPEDNATARKDYDLQMAMIAALAGEFRGKTPIRITLHAGELTAAIAPPEDLAFHIRHAIDIAHAERIGHGVDVLGEANAPQLVRDLRDRGITVEICLSSNAFILDVAGPAHPLGQLLAAGVPVSLSTDDAGVSRSSLTGELIRAVTVQGLRYPQLKAMARNSLTAAFVPGDSLWAAPGQRVAACSDLVDRPETPACHAFLLASERARLQWKLEQQFVAYESE